MLFFKHNYNKFLYLLVEDMRKKECRECVIEQKLAQLHKLFYFSKTNKIENINIDLIKKELSNKSFHTLQNYMITGNNFYKLLKQQKVIKQNPFNELNLLKTKNTLKQEKNNRYKPFHSNELSKIFNPKTYNFYDNKERFYIPLIALTTGMRLNEICQLDTKDVLIIGKKYYFSIKEQNEKRTKNVSSNRIVPVPKILYEFNFDQFVKSRKKCQKLWNLKLDTKGYYSKNISIWFNHYLDTIKIKDKTKVFHSFRHTFRTNCSLNRLSAEIVNALGGWSSRYIGESYANGFTNAQLQKAINTIKYPVLDRLLKEYKKINIITE